MRISLKVTMKSQHKASEYTLREQEVQKMFNAAPTFEFRVMLKCMYWGALRVFEVANLQVEDIDLDRRRIHVMDGKGGKTGTIPIIDADFLADLKHLIGQRRSGKLFPYKKRWMQRVVERVGVLADIKHPNPHKKHINPHLFRHSIARHLKRWGYQAEFIKNHLRHESINTTYDQYGTMSLDEMQEENARKREDLSLLPQVKEVKRLE